MPISLKCAQCGKQYQVGDNLAGKRIKCKDCGATVPVPGGAAPAPAGEAPKPKPPAGKPASAASDGIAATCGSCGKQIQVKSSLAGKRVKCQQCGMAVAIPGGEGQAAATAAPGKPKPAAAPKVAAKPAAVARAAAPPAAAPNPLGSLFDEEFSAGMTAMPTIGQMYCPGCKAVIADNAVLCVQCGFKLESGRTMTANNTANKPVHNPGRMTAWGILGGIMGILYALTAAGLNGLLIWGAFGVLLVLGLPNEENAGSAVAFFGLPVFVLMFTAAMLMLVSCVNILRSVKGAIPNSALASKIFIGAYLSVAVLLTGLTVYGIYKASKGTQTAVDPNKKVPPKPEFHGAAAALHDFTLATAITIPLVMTFLAVTAMVIGVPIYLCIFAATQGKRIDWALAEETYKGRQLKVIDPTKRPESMASVTGIRCPNCGNGDSEKVRFTWWGGMVGPLMFSVVRCRACSRQYNGNTGGDLTMAIALYFGFFLVVSIIGAVFTVMAKMSG